MDFDDLFDPDAARQDGNGAGDAGKTGGFDDLFMFSGMNQSEI